MNAPLTACTLLLCLAAVCTGALNSNDSVPPETKLPLQIVTCREDVDMQALLDEHHISLQGPKHKPRAVKVFIAALDKAAIQRLKNDPRVEAVEADGPISLCAFPPQFGLNRIGIPTFPPAHINGTPDPIDVDVAIVDTGISPHQDLNIFTNYSSYKGSGLDLVNHGTGVAGVIGMIDNSLGFVGVAPGVRLWNVQCSGPPPFNNWSQLLDGLSYVEDNADKISVVNISLSNEGTGAPVSSFLAYLRGLVRKGVVVVAGAGNLGRDMAGPDGVYGTGDDALPASMPQAMAVSGMDATIPVGASLPLDRIWEHSNL